MHFFCTYVRVRTQLQILRFFLCLRTIAKPVANFAEFGKIVTYDFSQFFVMLMSVTQVEPSCGVSKFAKIARLTIFRNPLSYALVLCPSVNQPRVTSLTVSFRSVHSTTALNFWAWGTCASFSISHFENYQTVTRGYIHFFLFCFVLLKSRHTTVCWYC